MKYGLEKEEVNKFFRRSTATELEYLTKLYKTFSVNSKFYKEDDLENLKEIIVSEEVENFYKENEPQNLLIFKSGVRLLSLKSIRNENSSGEPSVYLINHGVMSLCLSK